MEEKKVYKCENDILCGVNRPKDPSNMTDFEKKHTPVITAPDKVKKDEEFDVTIEVGKLFPHPNEPGHFIEWVELYSGDTFLARAYFNGGSSAPKVTFRVKLSHSHGILKAWEMCNLHGLWQGEKPIEIVE
ncbi:MAG: class II SORL domain-containing protein [Candidatus Omnitrophica bacterium]|nr:class II SORL domain-containing protein [Candidatus Omnitrophota bacterium]MCM8816783.1 class II SORL domain-containing protein [Candidatus Omnitrophota bacterium]